MAQDLKSRNEMNCIKNQTIPELAARVTGSICQGIENIERTNQIEMEVHLCPSQSFHKSNEGI
jgi:hypothetical protein